MKIHKTPTLLFLQKRVCSVIVEDPGKGQMGPRGGNRCCRSWVASNCDFILLAPSWGPHAHSNIGSVGSCRRRRPGSSGQRKVRCPPLSHPGEDAQQAGSKLLRRPRSWGTVAGLGEGTEAGPRGWNLYRSGLRRVQGAAVSLGARHL